MDTITLDEKESILASENGMTYQTSETNPHGLAEELQWARILSSGDPIKGMLIVLEQKMCTAFHEFAPAWRAGALNAEQFHFFRERLAKRIQRVLTVMRTNELMGLPGYAELENLLRATESAASMGDLANLVEQVHATSHIIADALEAR